MKPPRWGSIVLSTHAALYAALAAEQAPMLRATTPPIVYTINYSGDYFEKPEYIEQFKAAPPDLLHVGKATPITHLWGPIRLYQGENQYTGGPKHTLSWENIALLSPDALAKRIETICETLRRYHAIGIAEITPYISYHTLAGDHEKRKGFWEFYDKWDAYAKWAGPKPLRDPFAWLAVDIKGKFLPGSCGGYSPDYFAPLHRYRACISHPDWAEWHRRLIRMIAQVGYDGCFVDNAHPDPCFCRYCKEAFRKFLDANPEVAWVKRMTEGLDFGKLTLDSPEAPKELVRRWRVLSTGEHLGMLRDEGRKVKPAFTIFPNSGRIDECLQVGGQCDRLMFESTYSPGIACADEPPESEDIAIAVSADSVEAKTIVHRYELNDPATWMEMQAEIVLPTKAKAGKATRLEVRLASVGSSLQDEDAAEDFHLLLRCGDDEARVDLEPKGALGGTGSSRKPKQPPATLAAMWTPNKPGRYTISFGFRYTDDSHKETRLRPRLDKLTWGTVCRTHMANLLFARHMQAKPIYLGYEAARKGFENVQELALAEMAAFSGGGGFAGRGEPQAKYRAFFRKHPDLFDGWELTAAAAVLYSYWGPNPLNAYKPLPTPTIADYLGATHRPFVTLVDRDLPEKAGGLARFRVIYLPSRAYEMSEAQLAALREHFREGGEIVLVDDQVTINGQACVRLLTREVKLTADAIAVPGKEPWIEALPPPVWDWRLARQELGPAKDDTEAGLRWLARQQLVPTQPIASDDGLRTDLRFALYSKGGRVAVHAVNYNVCLLDPGKKVLEVEPAEVRVPVPPDWRAVRATCFDPDAEVVALPCTVKDGAVQLTLPKTRIYKIVFIERR
ncbi:MAG TPA: hypothetical protein VNE39_22755 [Planctomycetota bacterium]|nr:hypothetical protein [Planctomycetota bacterium]